MNIEAISMDSDIHAENDFQMQQYPDFYADGGYDGMTMGAYQAESRQGNAGGSKDLNDEFEKCNDLLDEFF